MNSDVIQQRQKPIE